MKKQQRFARNAIAIACASFILPMSVAWAEITYKGTYTCPQGVTDLKLVLSDDLSTGTFNFSVNNGGSSNGIIGSFSVTGYKTNNEIKLISKNWINQPSGWQMVDLYGTISDDKNTITGLVDVPSSSCTTFTVTKDWSKFNFDFEVYGMTLSDKNELYIATGSEIQKIDLKTLQKIDSFSIPGSIKMTSIVFLNGNLWIGDHGRGFVYVVDANKNTFDEYENFSNAADSIGTDGNYIYIQTANPGGKLAVIDPNSRRIVKYLSTSVPDPTDITYDGNRLIIIDESGALYAVDKNTGQTSKIDQIPSIDNNQSVASSAGTEAILYAQGNVFIGYGSERYMQYRTLPQYKNSQKNISAQLSADSNILTIPTFEIPSENSRITFFSKWKIGDTTTSNPILYLTDYQQIANVTNPTATFDTSTSTISIPSVCTFGGNFKTNSITLQKYQLIANGGSLGLTPISMPMTIAEERMQGIYAISPDIWKAIKGELHYDPSNKLNVSVLDNNPSKRLALQAYYRNQSILDASFSQWNAAVDAVEKKRAKEQAYIDLVKSVIESFILYEDLRSFKIGTSSGLEKVDAFAKVAGQLAAVVTPAATILTDNENEAAAKEKDWLKGFSGLVSGLGVPGDGKSRFNSASIGGFADILKVTFLSDSEAGKKAVDTLSTFLKCATDITRNYNKYGACLLDTAELVTKGISDIKATNELWSQSSARNAAIAARIYLDAFYRSAADPQFMMDKFGIPVRVEEAADYFGNNNKDVYDYISNHFDGIDFFNDTSSIDKVYFTHLVESFIKTTNDQVTAYKKQLDLANSSLVTLTIKPLTTLSNNKAIVNTQVDFGALVKLPSGYKVSSMKWSIAGADDCATASAFAKNNSASFTFSKIGNQKVLVEAQIVAPDGTTSLATNAFTLTVSAN